MLATSILPFSAGFHKSRQVLKAEPACIALLVAYKISELEIAGFYPLFCQYYLLWIDVSQCHRINFSLTAVHCFLIGYVGKQPVAWKEYGSENW